MAAITEIPGVSGPTLELLHAAGIETSGQLVALSPRDLVATLDKINAVKKLVEHLPAESVVESWQRAARIFEGASLGMEREVEISSEVMAGTRLSGLPIADLVPSQQLRSAGVSASSVPVGRLVEQVVGGLRLAEREGDEPGASDRHRDANPAETQGEPEAPQALLGRPVRQLKAAIPNEEEASMQFPTASGERMKDSGLERRNHGMSHKEPFRVYLGALAALFSTFLVVVGFVAVAVALGKAFVFKETVPIREAVILVVFPVALFIYVAVAMKVRCRLCGQRLFIPRQCRKHQRAHRSIFGYLFALATHILIHGWFRCMLCGTKQRLKE